MILCPATGQMTYTGIEAERGAFQRDTTLVDMRLSSCEHCGGTHLWQKDDVTWEALTEFDQYFRSE